MSDELNVETPSGLVSIRVAAPAEVVELRHAVLRTGYSRESAIFPGDEDADSLHVAATDGAGRIVGCATIHTSSWDDAPAWRLRGMATAPEFRGVGIGTRMLQLIERHVYERNVRTLWCNARLPAVGFYERNGWTVMSEVFDIPTAGPHVKMLKKLIEPDLV